MGWVKKGSLKGPQGAQGPKATTAESFLAAHPVGSVVENETGANPGAAYGGTWAQVPSLGAFKFKRTK